MTRRVDDLNLVRTFVAVADAGSFTAAADRLGLARPQVSQQIQRLERALGTEVFQRTTRRVALTEPGRVLYEQCRPLLLGIEESLGRIGETNTVLTGRLRISAPVEHAAQVLTPVVRAFAERHPALQIELRATDRVQDLVAEGIDLAIRVGWLRDSSARATKLSEFEQGVLASPDYIRRRGSVRTPEELSGHEWIALTLLPSPLTWSFTKGADKVSVRMRSRIRTDSPVALRSLLLEGAGVSVGSLLDLGTEMEAGRLVRMLPDWSLPQGGVYAVYPPGAHIAAASRAFVDFLRPRLTTPA